MPSRNLSVATVPLSAAAVDDVESTGFFSASAATASFDFLLASDLSVDFTSAAFSAADLASAGFSSLGVLASLAGAGSRETISIEYIFNWPAKILFSFSLTALMA